MAKNSEIIPDKDLPRVVVITGNDSIGREKVKEKIFETLYSQFKDLSEMKFDSSIESFETYLEHIITPSLFQNARIFHIRHAEEILEPDLQKLVPILTSELTDVYILIEYEKKSGKKGKGKSVAQILDIKKKMKKDPKRYVFFQFEKPPDYKIAQWLTTQVPILFNRRISKSSAEYLVDLVGNELDKLYSELQKIDINLPEKAPIDHTVIKSIIGSSRAMNAFELAQALGQKDVKRMLEIIDSIYTNNISVSSCIAVLFRHFWKVLKIRAYLHEERGVADVYAKARYMEQTKVAHKIGVASGILNKTDSEKKAYPVMVLSGIIDQASHFTSNHLRQIFSWLQDFDVGVKTGRLKPSKQAFEFLCYKIIRVAELQEKEIVL
jgi:DNA polymerase III delta subunit